MELFSVHKTFNQSKLGEEKHQMLNLNRRLESYLSRVKVLEEENALLAKEIQALRCSNHGALTRRKGLEEELHHARLEVDAAWRDRVYTEFEIGRLSEQLQALDLQRQREAQAQVEAKTKLEKSRKELEEEQRAQIWLREKVSQLEHEMRHLIQTHEEDVAQLEATLSVSRSSVPPTLAHRGNQMPNLLELGHEFSQQATRAWQEAAEAYQGQLARLEDSLNQARYRLTQVGQEKLESQLKLQALEKEIASAHDIRMHLEKNVAQQGHRYSQEVQELQEHLEGLEAEREELGQQIERILLENRGLLQAKMSLGLEVATYRALLDNESVRGDTSDRNITITDAVFSPRGVKKNYQTQLSSSHKTTSSLSVRGITGTGQKAITETPIWRKPVTLNDTPRISMKSAYDAAKSETPYPKILQDGAIENFRPQEVNEKVTYAEPLSPPNEQEAPAETTSDNKEGEENRNKVDVEHPEERPSDESLVSYQVESGLSTKPPLHDDVCWHQFNTPNLTPYHVRMNEERCSVSDELDKDVSADKQDVKKPHAPVAAWEEKKCVGKDEENLQEETSDSETEAELDPNFESRTGSPVSEFEPEERQDENMLEEDAVEMRQEMSRSLESTHEKDVGEKLYPDGEEMDTWDSVIEKKVTVKKDDGLETDEERLQHAEPEEDISAREQEREKREIMPDIQQQDNVASSITDKEENDDDFALDQEHALLSDKEDDEEEDSQNVSVSWRTELESDSYAQDNTLADTRPLIRYKSDETDGNAHVSHMDESESSDGEQEKKVGETGNGTWGEGKSKRFGTMEDLCEEVEGEVLDEDYDLGYTHIEDRGVGYGMTVSEDAAHMNATESAKEMIRKESEGHSDVETEEPMVTADVDYEEELETDRLVEQELENLATDSYSAHFAQQQIGKSEEVPHLQCTTVEEMTGPKDTGKTKAEDISSCAEPEEEVNHELASSTTIRALPFENLYFSDSSVGVPQKDTDEMVLHKDQEATDALEKRMEDDEHNVSVWMPTDNSEETKSVLQMTADKDNLQDVASPTEVEEVVPVEASIVSQDTLIKDVEDCQDFPEVPETAEWEVLENPNTVFEIKYQNEDHEKCDNVPESPERSLQYDGSKEEPLEMSPESAPGENDIFVVKDSAELLNTNGKDLHGFFSSGVQNDFWASSLETGATYQPDNACNEAAAEQINKNQGFADNSVWGNVDEPNVVNKNSKADIDSTKALATKAEREQIYPEVKQVLCRNAAEGEFVHSEESDVEGESWSSGEEPV
uniref:nestin n=1 Tax=Semicossyphus pulcher TaxID=241346 RepID=UPI0037E721ED